MTGDAPGGVPDSWAPPWSEPGEWAEANASMARAIQDCGAALAPALESARRIQDAMEAAFPVMDALCAETCPQCQDPCCVRARVWADFRDLLFMRLAGAAPPPDQLKKDPGGACAHLGPRGCTLPRLSRPFVCFWHLCPAQNKRLDALPGRARKRLAQTIEDIKQERKRMEAAFIRASAGHIP